MSQLPGGRRGSRLVAGLVAFVAVGVPGAFAVGANAAPASAAAVRVVSPAQDPSDPVGGAVPLDPTDPSPADTNTDPPTPDPTDTTTPDPTDTPTIDPTTDAPTPTDTPTIDPTTDAPTPPAPVYSLDVGVDTAELGPGYWNGQTASYFTIYVTNNSGNVTENVNISYTLPAGVTEAAGSDCPNRACSVVLGAPGDPATPNGKLLRVNITVNNSAWKNAPLQGSVSAVVNAGGVTAAAQASSWDVIFPPGPPVVGLTLTADQMPLAAKSSTGGQLTVHFTDTSAIAGHGVVQIVSPVGATITTFPAACATHQVINPTTVSCDLGTVSPNGPGALVFGVAVDERIRKEAPVAGVVRATLTPPGQDPIVTQTSWQILAPPNSPGAIAADGVLPSPSPSASPSTESSPEQGTFDEVTSVAAAAVQVVGWKLMLGSLVLLIVVLVAMTLGLRRRRVRAVPLFPSPVPLAPRPVSTSASTAVVADNSRIQRTDGGPLPQRLPAEPPDASLGGTRPVALAAAPEVIAQSADASDSQAPESDVAAEVEHPTTPPTARPTHSGPAVAGRPTENAPADPPERIPTNAETGRLPVAHWTEPFTGTGFDRGAPINVMVDSIDRPPTGQGAD